MMGEHFEGYKLRFSKPDDGEKVWAFYSDESIRPDNVYLRHESIVKNHVANGRFVTIWKDNTLIAGAGIYLLADGRAIDCDISDGRTQRGIVAEIGSVLRHQVKPNKGYKFPKGFFHQLLFGSLMIEGFRLAAEELTFNMLVSEVHRLRGNKEYSVASRLRGDHGTLSPLRWQEFIPANDLMDAFKATTNDPNFNRSDKEYYRAYVPDLLRVADYFMACCSRSGSFDPKHAILSNRCGGTLTIDLSGLPLDLIKNICKHRDMFDALKPEEFFVSGSSRFYRLSWSEISRQLRDMTGPTTTDKPENIKVKKTSTTKVQSSQVFYHSKGDKLDGIHPPGQQKKIGGEDVVVRQPGATKRSAGREAKAIKPGGKQKTSFNTLSIK